MEKITYLIGAGASTGSEEKKREIPILNGLIDEFKALSQKLKFWAHNSLEQKKIKSVFVSEEQFRIALNELVEALNELSALSKLYGSIDSYAKRVNRFDDGDSPSYRKTLSTYAVFFIIIENGYLRDKRFDQRYVNFLSNILSNDDGSPFRQNIDILSWNYDSQFEIALNIVLGSSYNSINNSFLKLLPKKYNSIHDSTNFLIKLNGEAQFIYNESDRYKVEPFIDFGDNDKQDVALIKLISTWYDSVNDGNKFSTGLSFSWDLEKNNSFYKTIKERTKGTKVLVIIGYSLPFFNRQIDKSLIYNMNPTSIYIQDKDPENVKNKLILLLGKEFFEYKEVKTYDNLNSFVLPIEL